MLLRYGYMITCIMSNIYINTFIFFDFCQDTTIYVPTKEPENRHGSIDVERTVIIFIGSTIIFVLILLILLQLYKKRHIFCTKPGVLPPDDVYETIHPAIIDQRLHAMIDRMCLCCSSVPNNEQYALHPL